MSTARLNAASASFRIALLAVPLALIVLSGCISTPFSTPSRLREQVVVRSERVFEWNKIAIIDIDGAIGIRRGLFGLSGTGVSDVKQKLNLAAGDPRVKGVLLRINSPGGEVVACDLIYNEIRAFSEDTRKPVVAYVMNMGASGGYYIALSSDYILAHPGAIMGSVGVIMNFVNIEMLSRMLGIESIPVASGEKKDMGSATRPMTDEELALFEEMTGMLFDKFINLVRTRRRLSGDRLDRVADGRLLLGGQAMELGLIDGVGMIDDAINEVKRRAGISTAHVVAYTPFAHYNSNVYATFQAQSPNSDFMQHLMKMLAVEPEPQFLYMWAPGK